MSVAIDDMTSKPIGLDHIPHQKGTLDHRDTLYWYKEKCTWNLCSKNYCCIMSVVITQLLGTFNANHFTKHERAWSIEPHCIIREKIPRPVVYLLLKLFNIFHAFQVNTAREGETLCGCDWSRRAAAVPTPLVGLYPGKMRLQWGARYGEIPRRTTVAVWQEGYIIKTQLYIKPGTQRNESLWHFFSNSDMIEENGLKSLGSIII